VKKVNPEFLSLPDLIRAIAVPMLRYDKKKGISKPRRRRFGDSELDFLRNADGEQYLVMTNDAGEEYRVPLTDMLALFVKSVEQTPELATHEKMAPLLEEAGKRLDEFEPSWRGK
jgi:hypothetical protein